MESGAKKVSAVCRKASEEADREWRQGLANQGPDYTSPKVEVPNHIYMELRKLAMARLAKESPIDATLPPVAEKLYRAVSNPNVSLPSIGKLIGEDPSLAGRLMGLANSAFFSGETKKTSSVDEAVLRLGTAAIRTMIILPVLQDKLVRDPTSQELWQHARAVAAACPFIASLARTKPDAAFLAGLLHDAGKIIIWLDAKKLEQKYGDLIDAAASGLHEEIGAQLAIRWGLAPEVAEAIGDHHEPDVSKVAGDERLRHVVCIADKLVHGFTNGVEADPTDIPSVAALKLPATPVRSLAKRTAQIISESRY